MFSNSCLNQTLWLPRRKRVLAIARLALGAHHKCIFIGTITQPQVVLRLLHIKAESRCCHNHDHCHVVFLLSPCTPARTRHIWLSCARGLTTYSLELGHEEHIVRAVLAQKLSFSYPVDNLPLDRSGSGDLRVYPTIPCAVSTLRLSSVV